MAGEKLAGLISGQKTSPDAYPELLFGIVTSTNPLTLFIDGKYSIDANTYAIILHECVTKQTVDLPVVTVKDDRIFTTMKEFTLTEPLQRGESVRILRAKGAQLYYVLGRGGER